MRLVRRMVETKCSERLANIGLRGIDLSRLCCEKRFRRVSSDILLRRCHATSRFAHSKYKARLVSLSMQTPHTDAIDELGRLMLKLEVVRR